MSKRQELEYRVQAISRALDSWNDLEAVRLLRLSWKDIERALRQQARNRDRRLRRILLASAGTGNSPDSAATSQQGKGGPLMQPLLNDCSKDDESGVSETSEPTITHAGRRQDVRPVSGPSLVTD